jgi:dTDP-4-amino-4,6-dideoxygalactose transaminase
MAVIEDCCHMIGIRNRDLEDAHTDAWEPLGWQSDAAFYSSHWSKPFTTGIGGWARSGDESLQARLNEFARRECTSSGALETAALAAQIAVYKTLFRPSLFWTAQYVKNRLSRWGLFAGGTQRDPFDRQMPADYCKRMSWLQRALGRREVRRQGRYLEHRRHLRQLYEEALRAAGLPTLDVPDYADPVLLRYPIRVPDKERILHEARRRRVELDWVDHPLDPPFADMQALGWREGECPEAEMAAAQVVGLPMHLRVRRGNVRRAVKLLRDFR